MNTETVNPVDLMVGDTIVLSTGQKTVGKETVKSGYFGTLVDGERLKTVERVLFPKWFKGEVTGYHSQI